MGSKARIAKHIAPIINKLIVENNIDHYIEPFVGGANMIEHIVCKSRAGFDINPYLIALWNGLRYGYEIPVEMSKDDYLYWRGLYQHPDDTMNDTCRFMIGCAGFLATYNAKFFGGYAGVVTTKTGIQRNYYAEARRNILAQLPKVKDVVFACRDYSQVSYLAGNCLIYCDPPYSKTTKYETNWNAEPFWSWVRRMSKKHIVLVSEYNAPDDFECILEVELTTTLDKNSRKKDVEKLFRLK